MVCKECQDKAMEYRLKIRKIQHILKLRDPKSLSYHQKQLLWGDPITEIRDGEIYYYWKEEINGKS